MTSRWTAVVVLSLVVSDVMTASAQPGGRQRISGAAIVVTSSPGATVQRRGNGSEVPLRLADEINPGDVIRTSQALGMLTRDESTLALAADSQLTILRFDDGSWGRFQGIELELVGSLRIDTSKRAKGRLVRVKTPAATVETRGTGFLVWARSLTGTFPNPRQNPGRWQTTVHVYNGQVKVANVGSATKSVNARQNNLVTVYENAFPSQPAPFDLNAFRILLDETKARAETGFGVFVEDPSIGTGNSSTITEPKRSGAGRAARTGAIIAGTAAGGGYLAGKLMQLNKDCEAQLPEPYSFSDTPAQRAEKVRQLQSYCSCKGLKSGASLGVLTCP